MSTEAGGFPPDEAGTRLAEALDAGYMSLPADVQQEIEAASERELLGRLVREIWVAAVRELIPDPKPSWTEPFEALDSFQREVDMRIGEAVAAAERERIAREAARLTVAIGHQQDGGQWMTIAFMGHNEYTGYVTEITKNGQPAYRVELPGKLWGGNPLAYVEYAASAWFSEYPVTEESVRRAWEAECRRAAEQARRDAEWERMREQRALGAAEDDDGDYEREPF